MPRCASHFPYPGDEEDEGSPCFRLGKGWVTGTTTARSAPSLPPISTHLSSARPLPGCRDNVLLSGKARV